MDSFMFALLVLLSTADFLLIPGGLMLAVIKYLDGDTTLAVVGLVMAGVGFIMMAPLKRIKLKYKERAQTDEDGRLKGTKFSELSNAERQAIAKQRTAMLENIVSTSELNKKTKKGSENPEADMNALVGLDEVKKRMREMVARMEFDKNDKKLKNSAMSGRHMVFYGSPGTGKTTVARIITGFLYKNGYIKKNQLIEVDGNFLKAGEYTAMKTEEIIRRARGSVLFIDEAYALMQSTDGSGQEAIATLIKQMEDMRSDFILIMAGYTREMQALLRMNPGFSSRIKEYLDFPDYDDESMRQIFTLMAKSDGFTVDPKAYEAFDIRVDRERNTMSFGNGRTARNILDEARNAHALNFIEKHLPESQRYVISYDDIPQTIKRSSGF